MPKNALLIIILSLLVACSPGQPPPQATLVSTSTVQPTATLAPTFTPTALPSPTPAPSRTPAPTALPSVKTLVPRAEPLCEAAASSPVATGSVDGRVFVLFNDSNQYDTEHKWTYIEKIADGLAFAGASSALDVNGLVCIHETINRKGNYTDGSSAYGRDWEVWLLQWPGGAVIAKSTIEGGAAFFASDSDNGVGAAPVTNMLQWLVPQLNLQASGIFFTQGSARSVSSVAFSPDATRLASAERNSLELWDIATRKLIRSIKEVTSGYDLAWSPDGTRLAVTGPLAIWNPDTAQRLVGLVWKPPEEHTINEFATGLAWSPDSTRIVSTSVTGTLFVWDAKTGQQLQTLLGYEALSQNSKVLSGKVAWSPDGTLIALSSRQHQVSIWEVDSGEQLESFVETDRVNGDPINDVAWSPDSEKLAYVTQYSVVIWDVPSGSQFKELRAGGNVYSVVWSPDGRLLASTSNNTIVIWDVETGKQLKNLEGHVNTITSLAWSSDGRWLASGAMDGFIKLWDMTGSE